MSDFDSEDMDSSSLLPTFIFIIKKCFMIHVGITLYKNYDIYELCVNHFLNHIKGEYKLFICDNTPKDYKQYERWIDDPRVEHHILDCSHCTSDGESSGLAKDFLTSIMTAEIQGHIDTDIFFFDPDILYKVEDFIKNGGSCYGLAGYYTDWQNIHDPRFPNRQGHMAPVSIAFFLKRELAQKHTYITTWAEGEEKKEQMWRLREYLIENKLPVEVIPGFYDPLIYDPNNPQGMVFYGTPDKRMALHTLKGSFGLEMNLDLIKDVIEKETDKWTI